MDLGLGFRQKTKMPYENTTAYNLANGVYLFL